MHIESPVGEFSDYAIVRLTRQEVVELRDVLNRMLEDGPSPDFHAYVMQYTTGTQMDVAWDLGD